ncbi:hypothetical protein ABVT39_005397 [Epinephelus coioides]
MLSLRLLVLTRSTQKHISKPETCSLVNSIVASQFSVDSVTSWSENSIMSLLVFSSTEKHFDSMLSLRLLLLTRSTQKQVSKPETCSLVNSIVPSQFSVDSGTSWSENSIMSLLVFSSNEKHFDSMLSLRLLLLTRSTQKQVSKPETCSLVNSIVPSQFSVDSVTSWSENSIMSLLVFSSTEKHFDSMLSLRLLLLTRSTQKQVSKPETCSLVNSIVPSQFSVDSVTSWSENSIMSLLVFSSTEKHFDSMLSLRLLLLTRSTQKQVSKPETCSLVNSIVPSQFSVDSVTSWSENSIMSLLVFSSNEKHFDSMLSLRLLLLTRSTQKQISKPETCSLVNSIVPSQFSVDSVTSWSENSIMSLLVFSSNEKHFDSMLSLRLLVLTRSTQKQGSKPERCSLVISIVASQFSVVSITSWSENSIMSLLVFSRPKKHFDSMLSLRLLLLTRSTQKQISKPETCSLVNSIVPSQFSVDSVTSWSENSIMSLLVFSSTEKHFDSMLSLRLLVLTRSTQKQGSKPERCSLLISIVASQFSVVSVTSWSENSIMSLLVFSSTEKHFDSMLSLRLLLLTRSTQKQVSKPETCSLVNSIVPSQFSVDSVTSWSENSIMSLLVFSSTEKHFDSMLSLRLLVLTRSTQKQISKPETCSLVNSIVPSQFSVDSVTSWSENSIMSLLVFSSTEKHFDSMLSLRLLLLTRSTQKQGSKPERCSLVISIVASQFSVVSVTSWSENSIMSLLVFSSTEKHFDSMLSLRLLVLTRSTQKQVSKPETCSLVNSIVPSQFSVDSVTSWSENSIMSLLVFSSTEKHFDSMLSLRLLLLTRSTQKQVSKPERCSLVISIVASQFSVDSVTSWSENSIMSLLVFSRPKKHFDSMLSLRLLLLTRSTQKQVSKPETCSLVNSIVPSQFSVDSVTSWSENSIMSLLVFSSTEKHFDSMLSLRLLVLTRSTQKQVSKPETCSLVNSIVPSQFSVDSVTSWSENSIMSLLVFSSNEKHFDSMLSLRLLLLTRSTQKQVSKPETCSLVNSIVPSQFSVDSVTSWSENSIMSLLVFSSNEKHFDSMLSLRLLVLTRSTQKQGSKPERCSLVISIVASQFSVVSVTSWSENSIMSLLVFSSPDKHFDSMLSLRLLLLTRSTQKQVSKPETCSLVNSIVPSQFSVDSGTSWSENSIMSLLVFSSNEKHFDSMLSLRLLLLTRSTQKQVSKPERCSLLISIVASQFSVVSVTSWSENSIMSLLVFSSTEKHFDSMLSLRLLVLTRSTQKQVSKPETCSLVNSIVPSQFSVDSVTSWSENSIMSLLVFSSTEKHFDSMLSLRLLVLTRSTQKQISKPETCSLVNSIVPSQFSVDSGTSWSENSIMSLLVFSSTEKHFDSMLSLRLLVLTRSTQKQGSKPERCSLVISIVASQFSVVSVTSWSENSIMSLLVFSSPDKHFESMLSLRLLLLTRSTQKQVSKPETCSLVNSIVPSQFSVDSVTSWSENSIMSLLVFSSNEKHFDSMLSLRLLLSTRSTQKQVSKPDTCGLVISIVARQFPLVFLTYW